MEFDIDITIKTFLLDKFTFIHYDELLEMQI